MPPQSSIELPPPTSDFQSQLPHPSDNMNEPSNKRAIILSVVLLVLLLVGGWLFYTRMVKKPATETTTKTSAASNSQQTQSVQGIQFDAQKAYGNKYANGIVPVGDGHYVTDGPKQGYIYMCNANFVPASQAGAQTRGPWFTNNNTQYDLSKKAHINGSVQWTPSMTNTISGAIRTISTNDLPTHKTGIFPVADGDPAHAYDSNPNSVKAQSLTYALNASPSYGTPQCMGGEAGVMLTGSALFNGFDAGGRDAGAWEVQDGCDGHPQNKGEYHYHSLSSCIADISLGTVVGFALDGFPITGPKVSASNVLTTTDLDECHGIVSPVIMDGKSVSTYHYVMTQDFPYSVSCFRSKPIDPPGANETGGSSKQPPTQPPETPPPHN